MKPVEIIVVGNEILLGQVQDTNSAYLSRFVRALGGAVRRIVAVGDEVGAIAEEVRGALRRGSAAVFLCGGLGPTADDLTLAAVAEALGVGLELDDGARDFVAARYADLAATGAVESAALNEARLKMARLPQGARWVENPVGTAPAVALEAGGALLVCLPGVPVELRAIAEGPLQEVLCERFGEGGFAERELSAACGDESRLAPLLAAVAAAHPQVYVKSRARGFGKDERFLIVLAASAASPPEAQALVERAASDLSATLRENGIAIEI